MRVGDIVARKDMPMLKFRILGTNKTFPDMWNVEPVEHYRGFGHRKKDNQMIAKDDDRWFVVKNPTKVMNESIRANHDILKGLNNGSKKKHGSNFIT